MSILLLLLQSLLIFLLCGQSPADRPRLLHPQILGNVLGSSGGLSDSLLLLLVVDGKDTCDGFTDGLDLGNFGGSATGDLGDVKVRQFFAEVAEGFKEFFLGKSSEFVCLDHFYNLNWEAVGFHSGEINEMRVSENESGKRKIADAHGESPSTRFFGAVAV